MRGVMRPILPVLLLALVLPARAGDATAVTAAPEIAPTDVGGWTPPRALTPHALTPDDYPVEALAAGEEGRATIRYQVGTDGTVTDTKVASTSGSTRLDEAATTVVKRWRFQPALRNGTPAPMWITAVISFKLTDVAASPPMPRPPDLPPGATVPIPTNSHRIVPSDYPPESIAAGEEGCTSIKYLIQADGTVGEKIVTISSGYRRIDDAALAVVSRWRFIAATRDKTPVAMWVTAKVIFFLHRDSRCGSQ